MADLLCQRQVTHNLPAACWFLDNVINSSELRLVLSSACLQAQVEWCVQAETAVLESCNDNSAVCT